jgi:hypothetical protein
MGVTYRFSVKGVIQDSCKARRTRDVAARQCGRSEKKLEAEGAIKVLSSRLECYGGGSSTCVAGQLHCCCFIVVATEIFKRGS